MKKDNSTKTLFRAAMFLIFCLICLLVNFALAYCQSLGYFRENVFYLIAINVLPAIASILGVSAVWEAFSKRSFAKEIIELSKVSNSYESSGIINVYDSFNRIKWEEKFKHAKNVTIFFSYGSSWRSENRKSLRELADNNANITVVLPDYNDESIIRNLNSRFQYDEFAKDGSEYATKSVKDEIKRAKQDFIQKYNAKVYLYKGTITSSYYLIDELCIYAPFHHSKEHLTVPAIECKIDGTWYNYCKRDIDEILKNSIEVDYEGTSL